MSCLSMASLSRCLAERSSDAPISVKIRETVRTPRAFHVVAAATDLLEIGGRQQRDDLRQFLAPRR